MTNSTEINLSPALPGIEPTKQILYRLFRNLDGSLRICLWDGSVVDLGYDALSFSLTFRSARTFRELVLARDPLRLAGFFFKGLIDIGGDLYSALKLRHHLASLQLSLTEKAELAAKALRIRSDKTALNGSDAPHWKKSVATEFINRYVFPDGQLETISTVQQLMEDARLEIHDVEGLREHYARTLREWVSRLELCREEALQHVSESTYRIWRPAPTSLKKAARGYTKFWRPDENHFPGLYHLPDRISISEMFGSDRELFEQSIHDH